MIGNSHQSILINIKEVQTNLSRPTDYKIPIITPSLKNKSHLDPKMILNFELVKETISKRADYSVIFFVNVNDV